MIFILKFKAVSMETTSILCYRVNYSHLVRSLFEDNYQRILLRNAYSLYRSINYIYLIEKSIFSKKDLAL